MPQFAGALFGARFDLQSLEPIGVEVRIAEGITFDQSLFRPIYSVGEEGSLVYFPGARFTEESPFSWQKNSLVAEPISDIRGPFIEPQATFERTLLSGVLKREIYRPFLYHLNEHRLEPTDVEGNTRPRQSRPTARRWPTQAIATDPYGIWKRDVATMPEILLMRGEGDVPRHLAWSPDNRRLVFEMSLDAGRGGSRSIDLTPAAVVTSLAADGRAEGIIASPRSVGFVANMC